MKTTLLSLLFVFLLTVPVLAQQSVEMVPLVDGLMGEFALAWSTDDVGALRNLMADDVALLGSDLEGVDVVIDEWAQQQMAQQDDPLVIVPLHSEVHGSMAHQMGLWQIGESEGIHTFIWEQGDDDTWRITQILIQDRPPQ